MDLESRARLVYWPDLDGSDSSGHSGTLRDVLREVDGSDERTPWIVTENGKILRPREIEALKAELDAPSKSCLSRALSRQG